MKKPDELLAEIEVSIFIKALVISIVAHFVLLGATSISLFKDWGTFGIHSPSYINAEKSRIRKEEEAAKRKAEAEKKAADEAAKAEAAKTNATAKASAPAKATPAAKEAANGGQVTPPEVEELPPKKEFQLGDDLSLD